MMNIYESICGCEKAMCVNVDTIFFLVIDGLNYIYY